jgi:hypothetical protein
MRIGLFVLVTLVGCKAEGFSTRNNEPAATIVYPLPGAVVVEDYLTVLRGTVTDTNDLPEELAATWFLGDDELCPSGPVAADGSTSCEVVFAPGDTAIRLVAVDPVDATGEALVDLVVVPSEAPTVTISAPADGGTWSADELIVFEAMVSDGEEAAADLTLAWTDASGGALDIDTEVDANGSLSSALSLPAGSQTVTLTATDLTGKSGSASVTLTVE